MKRAVIAHILHTTDYNHDQSQIFADEDAMAGGASYRYVVRWGPFNREFEIPFQNGSFNDNGVTGISTEALLAVVLDRLSSFQAGPFPCEENANALRHLREAMFWMHTRTMERWRRGVKGQAQP
jgi:hypothetical protein